MERQKGRERGGKRERESERERERIDAKSCIRITAVNFTLFIDSQCKESIVPPLRSF